MKPLNELYYEINELLKKIDFNNLWDGFKPLKFALYNDKECFYNGEYIEKTDSFLANTSINYQGEVIAIWNVMEEMDPILLTSKMVHEMYHGFQMINKESRFCDELDSLYKYKYDDMNFSIKIEENILLNELLDNYDSNKYNRLLQLRKYRYQNYNYEYRYEASIEQIEGTANYIELMVLKKLSNELYLNKLNDMKKRIITKKEFFPIRVLSYDIGALLLLVLNNNNIQFNKLFNDIPFSIDLIKDTKLKNFNIIPCFKEEITEYFNKAKNIIDKAIEGKNCIETNEYDLLGVNVYNAIFYNNYIISIYFVMYGDMNNPIIKYGNFVIESKKYKKLTKLYMY